MHIRAQIDIKAILKSKLFIFFIVLVIFAFLGPSTFIMPGTPAEAENALYRSEVYRNDSLWLFDNFLVSLLLMIFLLLMLDLTLRRRITILKRKTVAVALILFFVFPIIMSPSHIYATKNTERQTPIANKVFIITFDGTRADTFWNSDHWITQHKNEGAWATHFSCTYPTITYPNHISIVTGTWSQIHQCEMNRGYKEYRHPLILRDYHVPVSEDIFEVAEKYDIMTGLFIAPSVLASIIGTSQTHRETGGNAEANIERTISYITTNKDQIEQHGFLALIHLPDSDDMVHEYSTYSDEYRMAIEKQGNLVGQLIQTIKDLGWENDTIIIVTADHGAISYAHFNRYPQTVCDIPFWVWGGPIKAGQKIDGGRLVDIAVTVAFALGIPKPSDAIGVALYRIFIEDILSEKRSIANINNLILAEYRSSLFIAYIECVKYQLGFILLLLFTLLIIADIIKQRRTIRQMK